MGLSWIRLDWPFVLNGGKETTHTCVLNHRSLKNGRAELIYTFFYPSQNLLSLACYYKRVQYLIGRPVDYVDLDRAGAQNAHCILVLVNNSVADKQAEVYFLIYVVLFS